MKVKIFSYGDAELRALESMSMKWKEAGFPWDARSVLETLGFPGGRSFIAYMDNDEPDWLAMALIGVSPPNAEIFYLYVCHERRREGFSHKLMAAVVDTLEKLRNIETCTLEVRESNAPAIALYRKFDFIEIGRRDRYYSNGENAIVMKKVIYES